MARPDWNKTELSLQYEQDMRSRGCTETVTAGKLTWNGNEILFNGRRLLVQPLDLRIAFLMTDFEALADAADAAMLAIQNAAIAKGTKP